MPRSRRFDSLRRGSDEPPGDPCYAHELVAYEEMYGRHVCDDSELGADDRPHNVVENEDEVRLLFAEQARPALTCGYCGSTFRTRSIDGAVRWFHAHACDPQEAGEAAGIVWDVGTRAA